jgi:hypothetical protein
MNKAVVQICALCWFFYCVKLVMLIVFIGGHWQHAREVAKYKTQLQMGVHEVRWRKGGFVPREDYTFCCWKRKEKVQLETGILVHVHIMLMERSWVADKCKGLPILDKQFFLEEPTVTVVKVCCL